MGDGDMESSVELCKAQVALAERIVEHARWRDGTVAWTTPVAVPQSGAGCDPVWRLEDASPYVYDGLAGIARALAYAAPVVRNAGPAYTSLAGRMRETAACAVRAAVAQCRALGAQAPGGLYDGRMGVACVATEVGRLWTDTALEAVGRALTLDVLASWSHQTRRHARPRDDDGDRDLISGTAGAICGAAWVVAWTRDAAVADRLATFAQEAEGLWAFDDLRPGLAHGLAGVSVALAHLHRLRVAAPPTGARRTVLDWIRHAEQCEDAWFAQAVGSWPDVRPGDASVSHFPAWWCHGASGIGLARQRVGLLTGRPPTGLGVARAYARRVLQTHAFGATPGEASGAWSNWSLCHGAAGPLVLLSSGGGPTDDADRAFVAEAFVRGARRARDDGGRWRGGAGPDVEQSGLMTGHAGVMLTLTRVLAGESRAFWPLWL